ncbi:MAG: c-type cytochrome [Akkermansiaceae bacterium]|nr:c-type cytochrome [Akkermansiaceae bacterium]NNM28736.1 c-type cytochrome [Akkermansiaceae bacterium]
MITRLLSTAAAFLAVSALAPAQGTATDREDIRLPDGFAIERLYSVPKDTQGSWVAMCLDDKNRLIVSDQYGGLYRFPVPPAGEALDPSSIEQITYAEDGPARKPRGKQAPVEENPADIPEELRKLPRIGHAQGLCYAFDSLYVVVNSRRSATGSGVFRLLDTDQDDQFDKIVTIRKLDATGGEHGPHAIIKDPDGKHLLVVMGNQTQLPDDYTHSRVPELWGEDQLLPSLQHFMKGAEAPLGHVARIDPDGKTWEILATGFRNQYDAAFNKEGDLFTFDADMEWDLNTPWYRPTRVNHIVDGADFGWRTGSGKFPAYCTDTFGAVVDIGPGSPTGVCFGYGAKFPAKYQNALYICDWSYGKLYAVHLAPSGSSYSATFEEFASAQPLPLTDILVNEKDGAMYFTVGGRKVQSGLYRVTYTGKESTAAAAAPKMDAEMRKRREAMEAHLRKGAKPAGGGALDKIWEELGAEDRGIRHAARAALEKQPPANWTRRIPNEKNPQIVLAALIALARADGEQSAGIVINRATRIDYQKLENRQQRLDLIRALTLAVTRGGVPAGTRKAKLAKYLDGIYPARTWEENRDLSALVAAVEMPTAVPKMMALLEKASGQEEQIAYAINLRFLKDGWTPELREKYFRWFVRAAGYHGGAKFRAYVDNIKKDAVASVPEAAMTPELTAVINTVRKDSGPQFSSKPRKFVKMWSMGDLEGYLGAGLEGGRNFENGRQMFGAGTCYVCHRFNNEGGAVGPDLTAAAGKFSPRDLLESIIDPGKEISSQYGASVFTMKDGSQVIGRIMNLKEDDYRITTDMMKPSAITTVKASEVESIEPSPVSMMPPGLLATMEPEDILDLLAYLLSAGDPDHELFQ